MERIRRQFGKKFAEALATSPTLVADLEHIRRHGVTIRRVNGRCQAWSTPSTRMIYIGTKCSLVYKLLYLAHEAHHVWVNNPEPIARRTSRSEFIEMCLDEETDCIVHELEVAKELMDVGYKMDDDTMSWYRCYRRGGRDSIRRRVQRTKTSTTGQKYPEYYGDYYDETVKEEDRVPGRRQRTAARACDSPPDEWSCCC